jgi:uncharacterized phiE125 gp8 family phage protein
MTLSEVSAPAQEPLTLKQAKDHLRVDVDDDDELIAILIRAARGYVETFTHRALLAQTWDLKLDGFPCDRPWYLPKAPTIAVVSITYIATDGTSTPWTLYQTDLPSGPKAAQARIAPIYAGYYPSTRWTLNAVVVRFTAGYGTAASSVPAELLAAMKLLIGHWYERREPVNIGNLVTSIPLSAESLMWPFKSF